MIEPGTYICPYCARKYTEAFYRTDGVGSGAMLVRDTQGNYRAVARVAGGKKKADEEFTLVTELTDLEDGLPDQIRVEAMRSGKQLRMDRACPRCEEFPDAFPASYGKVPTYIVAVVGSSESGKTAWLDAVAQIPNMRLISGTDFPCKIEVSSIKYTKEMSGRTDPRQRGSTNYLLLKRNQETYAIVVLHDFGGELFNKGKQGVGINDDKRVIFWDILHMPDAYLFVADETVTNWESEKNRNGSFEKLRRECLNQRSGVPVGLILSHVDKMMEGASPKSMSEELEKGNWRGAVQFLSENTFRPDTRSSYTREHLLPRLELEDMIAMKYSDFACLWREQGVFQKSFLVKSCVSVQEESGDKSKYNNYSNGINVYDPLLWVLNQLRLFPL